MGASHCKDEEWRPDLYLKVAASIVPKELDITSQGVADMSDEDVLRIIDAVRALVADVELMLTPGQDHDLTCAEPTAPGAYPSSMHVQTAFGTVVLADQDLRTSLFSWLAGRRKAETHDQNDGSHGAAYDKLYTVPPHCRNCICI